MLLWDHFFAPQTLVQRTAEEQERINRATQGWRLYQFEACPFCVKVRRKMKQLELKIELRDVKKNREFEKELLSGGGEYQVPCLYFVDSNGKPVWMYESSQINAFLETRFLNSKTVATPSLGLQDQP